MQKAIESLAEGRVQGVNFRSFVKEVAETLGIVGFAENLGDGPVRVVAEGEELKLHEFIRALKRGPRGARVEHLRTRWTEPCGRFQTFEIKY